MPRIPTYTADPRGAPPIQYDLRRLQGDDLSAQIGLGQELNKAAEKMSVVADHLEKQQNEFDVATGVGQYAARERQIQFDVDASTQDPKERLRLYKERTEELSTELVGGLQNRHASAALQKHINLHAPVQAVDYQAKTIAFTVKKQTAELIEKGDEFSRLAANPSLSPTERDVYLKQYQTLLDGAMRNNLIDPVLHQGLSEKFREKSALDYMDILRLKDPDKLFELEDAGAFTGVDPRKKELIIDRAIREKAARSVTGQAALKDAMRVWVESIERETVKHIRARTLTQEWLDEYGYAMSSEKNDAYSKALHDQKLGIGGGDPTIERAIRRDVYDYRQDPRKTFDHIDSLYSKGLIGYENYGAWAAHLQGEITRRSTEARTIQNEGDARIREIQGRRFNLALDNAAFAFRTTGMLDKFDDVAVEAHTQFREELSRRADYIGTGREDSQELYRELLPKYIAQIDARMQSRLAFITDQLGPYPTQGKIESQRNQLGEEGYRQKVLLFQEYYRINLELNRLGTIRKQSDPAAKTTGTPLAPGRWNAK